MQWRNIEGDDTKKERLLDHYIRGQIYGYIVAQKIPHYNQIKRGLGLTNGTVAHHLRVLERNGIIKSIENGRKKHFYVGDLPEDFSDEPSEIEGVILTEIADHPGISYGALAKKLGFSPSTISYYVKRLTEKDLVDSERHKMRKLLFLKEAADI